MKRIKLLMLLPFIALASCGGLGKEITSEEAAKKATTMESEVAKDTNQYGMELKLHYVEK